MTITWTRERAARAFRAPTRDDDKYSRGVVGLRTGSRQYPGAAVLGVEGAWRAGAGMVRWIGDPSVAAAVLQRRPETVFVPGCVNAWVVGSGTSAAERTDADRAAIVELLAGSVPVVVDAGALDLVDRPSAPVVITPHAGEFATLAGAHGVDPSSDRDADALALATRLSVVVVLKGATTVIAAEGAEVVHVESNPWLATAGTGDVLAGIMGTVIAQNPALDLVSAAASAVFAHAHAAAFASGSDTGSAHPIVALDVAEALKRAIADLTS